MNKDTYEEAPSNFDQPTSTFDQISLKSGIVETTAEMQVSKELAHEYTQKAIKSLMWLSSYMKRWLRDYVIPLTDQSDNFHAHISLPAIEQRIIEVSPLEQAHKMRSMLALFTKLLKLPSMDKRPRSQARLIAMWDELEKNILASDEAEYFDVYQSLASEDLIDEQEFRGLVNEFKHDVNTAGLAVLDNEYSLTMWNNIRTTFDSPMTKGAKQHAANVVQKLEQSSKISPELLAMAIMKTYEVLHSFNLESGGAAYEPASVSASLDYIRTAADQAKYQYPLTIHFNYQQPNQEYKQMVTFLNKAALVRFFTNAFSNSARAGATDVEVQYELTGDHLSVAISDNGKGFKDTSNEVKMRLGNEISVFEIGLGKTSWDNKVVKGTGTGLAGLQNLVRSIDGELVAGNKMVDGKVAGGITVITAPIQAK